VVRRFGAFDEDRVGLPNVEHMHLQRSGCLLAEQDQWEQDRGQDDESSRA